MKIYWALLMMTAFIGGCATRPDVLTAGVIADVQYADKDTENGRYYRDSLVGLTSFVRQCNQRHVDFAIQLGDIIDDGDSADRDLEIVLTEYDQLDCSHYHVLGNHDFSGSDRSHLLKRMKLDRGYYAFEKAGVCFVVLDTQDVALQGGWDKKSVNYKKAEKMLEKLTEQDRPNAQPYDGAVGDQQLVWLNEVLTAAKKKKQDVVVFGHLPLWPDTDKHTAWNADEVRDVLERYGCVRVYLCGHNHGGGYGVQNGIHYVTLPALVDDKDSKTWTIVQIWPDKLVIEGFGNARDIVLIFEDTK